jgi:transposase InsO family protein
VNFRHSSIDVLKIKGWIRNAYNKPGSPQLNGKVERSHRTDQEEFYQLMTYTYDVDSNKKLETWEIFYNFNRPHRAFNGETHYESMKSIEII